MGFVYAFLIGAGLCLVGQLLAEARVPKPVLLAGFLMLGGILTPLGLFDKLAALSAGSMDIFACGLGNAGFGTAAQLMAGNAVPILMVLVLLVVLIGLGCLSGLVFYKRFGDKLPPVGPPPGTAPEKQV